MTQGTKNQYYSIIPDFPPFLPAGEWWKIRLSAMIAGASADAAALQANKAMVISAGSVTKARRNWMRFTISDRNGKPLMLSIPVNGSASALKNHNPEEWTISDHGDIKHTLRHTLSTEYGHTPFFRFIDPELSIFDETKSEDVLCSALCRRLDSAIMHILGLNNSRETLSSLRSALTGGNTIIKSRKEELMSKANLSLSIFDTLMRLGPETLILLT